MGDEQEATVRAFLAELECEQWDLARVDRALAEWPRTLVTTSSPGRIHSWAMTRSEPSCSARHPVLPIIANVRIDIVAIVSVGQIVFTERVDSGTLRGKPYAVHVAGVFEMDAEGKIAASARLPR